MVRQENYAAQYGIPAKEKRAEALREQARHYAEKAQRENIGPALRNAFSTAAKNYAAKADALAKEAKREKRLHQPRTRSQT